MSFWHAGQSNSSAVRFSYEDTLKFTHATVTESPYVHNADGDHELQVRETEAGERGRGTTQVRGLLTPCP